MALGVDVRSGFTWHLLGGASALSRNAFAVESMPPGEVRDDDEVAHRGFVVGAIIETVAALETEAWEVLHYGPGTHLGSNMTDPAAKALLDPLADLIDGQDVLSRYETILHLLRKSPIDRGRQPAQDAALLVRLRNEIVHYKSKWGEELERVKFMRAIEQKRLTPPPFRDPQSAFFPHLCLSASCAAWAVDAGIAFIDEFYSLLGMSSSLDSMRHWFRPRP